MDDDLLEAKARETNFCQRNRKLSPRHFLEMLLCKCFSANQESLVDHAIDLKLNRGIEIKKQSIHSRFTDNAVNFIKSLVSNQLSKRLSLPSAYLDMFPTILIQDSTRFGLPESFHEQYAGYGGRGAKAGGKIQFVYDLKTHQMCHSSLGAMTENDLTASKNNEWITEGALILRDLGYYSHDGLEEIANKKAFFISKVKPKTALFDLDGQRFELVKLVEKMKRAGIMSLEKELLIGHEKKIKARVIFSIVPDGVKKQRASAVAYKANNKNYTVQKEYKVWTGINVFITNVSKDRLTPEQIMSIYRLRWQVELVFKTWKSHYKIDQYKTMRKERMECYVYATLLLILLQWRIFSWLNHSSVRNGIFLSLHKFSKLMIHLTILFNEAVVRNKIKINVFLHHVIALSKSYLQKEKKKNKVCFTDIVNPHDYLSCIGKQEAQPLPTHPLGIKKYETSTPHGVEYPKANHLN